MFQVIITQGAEGGEKGGKKKNPASKQFSDPCLHEATRTGPCSPSQRLLGGTVGEAGPCLSASVFFLFPFLFFFQGKLGTSIPMGLPYGLQIPATPRNSLVSSLERLGRGASSFGQACDVAQCRKLSTVPKAHGVGGWSQAA